MSCHSVWRCFIRLCSEKLSRIWRIHWRTDPAFRPIAFLRVNRTLATLALAPSLCLALLLGWVLLRTVPFIGEFGKDAQRDSVIHVMTMPVLGTAAVMTQQELPQMPGTGLPILFLRPRDLAVHLAGAVVFVLVGLWRPNKISILTGITSFRLSSDKPSL